MLTTSATQNNVDVPFPFSPSREEETVLHPSTTAKRVAKGMEKLKKPLPAGSKEAGLQILQRMAAGLPIDHITEDTTIDDDSWLNSSPQNTQEHLEMPEWLKELSAIKEPPEIDKDQLQKVKEGLDKLKQEAEEKLRSSNENSEHSLLDTGTVEILMTPQSTSQIGKIIEEPMQATQAEPAMPDTERHEIIEATPTECIPVVRVSTPPVPVQEKPVAQDPITPIPATLAPEFKPELERPITPNPITPIPPALALGLKSVPDFERYQKKTSGSFKIKESHYLIREDENALDSANAAILKYRREHKEAPGYITISEKFIDSLNKDIEDVYGRPLSTHIPHITASGDAIGVQVMVNDKLRAAPNRIICIG